MQMALSCTVLNLLSDLYGLCPPFCVISMAFIAVQQANPFVLSVAAWKEHSSSTSFNWLILFFFFRSGSNASLEAFTDILFKDSLPCFSSYWFHFTAFFSTWNYFIYHFIKTLFTFLSHTDKNDMKTRDFIFFAALRVSTAGIPWWSSG